jgi:hypothetical protein
MSKSTLPIEVADREAVRRLIAAGVWLAVVFVAVQSLVDVLNEYLLAQPRDDLNPGREGTIFTWASVAATYAAGLAALLHAAVERRRRIEFALIGVILVYFSADDLLELHEQANDALRGGLPQAIENRLDVLLFAPLFGVLLLALVRVRDVVPRAARTPLYVGGACLILSVLFDEVIGEVTVRLYDRGIRWPGHVKGVFEEGLELGGVLLLATAMTAAAVAAIPRRGGAAAANRVVAVGVVVAAVAFAAQAATDLVNEFAPAEGYANLDPGVEGNVFTWLSVVALLSGGFLALVHGVALPARRYGYLALGALLCILSADDFVEAFGRLADRLPLELADPLDRRIVLLFELPLQFAALWLGWSLAASWPRTARVPGRIGVALLALGILLDEALLEATDRLRESRYADLTTIKGTLEEGVEVAGALLLSAGLAGALVARLAHNTHSEPLGDGAAEPPADDAGGSMRPREDHVPIHGGQPREPNA